MENALQTRTSLNLYQMNSLIKDITQNPVVDEATGEILSDRYEELMALEMGKEDVVKHVALSYKDLEGEIQKATCEKKRITDIETRLKKLQERARLYLKDNLEPGKNIKTLSYEIKWTYSESIEVDDILVDYDELKEIDPDLVRVKEEVNKVKAKELYKKNKVLPEGLSIVQKQNLTIK